MQPEPKPIYGWTWAIQDHYGTRWDLCWGCYPTRAALMSSGGKPSSEARPVRVLMSPVKSTKYGKRSARMWKESKRE